MYYLPETQSTFGTLFQGHSGGVTCLSTATTNAAMLSRSAKTEEASSKKSKKKGKHQKNMSDDNNSDDDWDDLCGGLIASAGHDFSIRLWSESEELLVLEEEAELAREAAAEEEELIRSEAVIPGAQPAEVSETGLLGKPTQNTRDAVCFCGAFDVLFKYSCV